MKFQTQFKVLGMKANKGMMDNGQAYDSCKVYVETPLDDSKGNAKGFTVAEYTIGDASEFEKYKHNPFPFDADAELEIVSTGKVQRTHVVSLKPLRISAAGKAA